VSVENPIRACLISRRRRPLPPRARARARYSSEDGWPSI